MKKTSLQLQHIDYFKEKGSILFHDVISEKNLHIFKSALCFLQKKTCRNCWSLDPILKKLSFNASLISIALQLAQTSKLRFGFDHVFASLEDLKDFFKPEVSLAQMSSIDGLEIAALINLSMAPSEEPTPSTFPLSSASGCFFHPKKPLDLSQIESASGPFFLITFCKPNARYIHQALDPYTHLGKQEGLAFGDLLATPFHPLLHAH